MLAASPRFTPCVHPGGRAAPLQLRLRANVVLPLGRRSNFKHCSTAKPGSQVGSQQGQEQEQPPGGGGKVPRTPSPGGSDGKDDQQPRGNSSGQGWSALMAALSPTQPALIALVTIIGAVGTIVHVLNAPLALGIEHLRADTKDMKSKVDKLESKVEQLDSKVVAEFKELKADIHQLMIALVKLEAQRDNSASGPKPRHS